ncbi:class II aldolase/adducin family protein [Pelagicoccus albus]|uniref:Class II aldolase/adducin family protein n=1 Tax=Pelagicoccus albus TaxID=415222 RepID=A0A7X1E7F3_9BACT|nr:class II aldolase/adducin family protein [Pelagicoccus albus]MBC2605224.1 class II aldolase/adducin family protein [Pelagicoccus albus]
MSKLYTAKDLEQLIKQGQSLDSVPANAKLTPMARDIMRKHKRSAPAAAPAAAAPAGGQVKIHNPVLPNAEYNWTPGGDPKTAAELEKFFYSKEIQALKERICHIGERIWNKGYVDGNGGNITVRVGDNLVLCTPTLISKGFMTPDDICMVDLDGNQVAGTRPRTSEVNTHLGIMKAEPKAKSCVHAHPVYATAFAVAGVVPPACLIPEPEVFLGEIGFASYQTPGTPENAKEVGALAKRHQSILMQNHGVICWGNDVEDAYWKMENTDAFCQTVSISMQIGGPKSYSPDKLKDLIILRKKLGMPDHRLDELKECELCDAGEFTVNTQPAGASCGCSVPTGEVDEALVQKITDQIMSKLG